VKQKREGRIEKRREDREREDRRSFLSPLSSVLFCSLLTYPLHQKKKNEEKRGESEKGEGRKEKKRNRKREGGKKNTPTPKPNPPELMRVSTKSQVVAPAQTNKKTKRIIKHHTKILQAASAFVTLLLGQSACLWFCGLWHFCLPFWRQFGSIA